MKEEFMCEIAQVKQRTLLEGNGLIVPDDSTLRKETLGRKNHPITKTPNSPAHSGILDYLGCSSDSSKVGG